MQGRCAGRPRSIKHSTRGSQHGGSRHRSGIAAAWSHAERAAGQGTYSGSACSEGTRDIVAMRCGDYVERAASADAAGSGEHLQRASSSMHRQRRRL